MTVQIPKDGNSTGERLRVVDLFSGAGGMSYGFHHLSRDFEIIGAVDGQTGKPGRGKSGGSSTRCNPTYQANIGIKPKEADLSELEPAEYRAELGLEPRDLEVLISCAPCTGFSQKNSHNHSEDDPRNDLIGRTADFVKEFQPEFLVMENVKELIRGNQSHHYKTLKSRLRAMKYVVSGEVHDLSEYGLPQTRLRAFILARREGPVSALPAPPDQPIKTVYDTIGRLPPIKGGEEHPEDPMHVAPANSKPVLDRLRAIPKNGGSWGDVMRDPTLTEEEKRYLLIPSMLRARPGQFPDVYGRLWWDRPAVTVTRECGHVGNGRYVHPEQDRLLSVREMAMLQGFPEDYEFVGPLTARYNQIGDAVPPLVSEQIARHILALRASGGHSKSATQAG